MQTASVYTHSFPSCVGTHAADRAVRPARSIDFPDLPLDRGCAQASPQLRTARRHDSPRALGAVISGRREKNSVNVSRTLAQKYLWLRLERFE